MSGFGQRSAFTSQATIAVFVLLLISYFGSAFVPVPYLSLPASLVVMVIYGFGLSTVINMLGTDLPIGEGSMSMVGGILSLYLFSLVVGFIHRKHSQPF